MELSTLIKLSKKVFISPPIYYYIKIININLKSLIKIKKSKLIWEEKDFVPRCLQCPAINITFFRWQLCIAWGNYLYYEQILWYLFYADKDLERAINTWDWIDGVTHRSTWNNNYLLKH